MPRYIDADALIKKNFPYEVIDTGSYSINAKSIYEAIKKAPTADVVEVVRCKECCFFTPCEGSEGGFCAHLMFETHKHSFCSGAMRKEKT